MTIQEDSSLSDPWDTATESVATQTPSATSTELLQSPAFPMILLICLAWLMFKGAVQLLCLTITSVIFIYRRLSRLSQAGEAKPQMGNAPESPAATGANPALAVT